MLRILSSVLLVAPSLCAGDVSLRAVNATETQHRRKSASETIARIPLQITNAHVTLELAINGQGPFLFGLDTGASHALWVTPDLVLKLKLPTVDGFRVSDGSGRNSHNVDGVLVERVQLGQISFNHLVAPVLHSGPSMNSEPTVYGSIGFELFKDHLVTIDYPLKELRLLIGKLSEADQKTVLNYSLTRRTPQIKIQIGSSMLDASMDSGANGGFLVPLSLADKLPLRRRPQLVGKIASSFNEVSLFRAELNGNIKIGNATIEKPVLLFAELFQQVNIGREVLQKFAITFDQKNMRVRLQPGSDK
jgi:predicted aspartyl protease